MTSVKKVAEHARVSTATVSRALSRPDMVAAKTRQKVMDAVAKVGYTGNYLARNLRTSKSSQVVVLVPNISNPYYSEVIRGMERVAHDYGYSVLLGDTQNNLAREHGYTKMLTTKQADGLITMCPRTPQLERSISHKQFLTEPVVNACERMPGTPMRTVMIDNVGAAKKATEHLLSLGHSRIAIIAGPPHSPLSAERFAGYELAMNEANLEIEDQLYAVGDWSIESGIVAAQQLMSISNPPTAVFCSNDEMALGLMTELKKHDIVIPDDMSVVGFDDIHFAQYFDPPLTTISQPMGELGERAMTILCEILAGRPPKVKDIILPYKLIVRETTGKPKSTVGKARS